MADKFMEFVEPETQAEIEAVLRSAGIDPEQAAARGRAFAAAVLARTKYDEAAAAHYVVRRSEAPTREWREHYRRTLNWLLKCAEALIQALDDYAALIQEQGQRVLLFPGLGAKDHADDA